MKNVITIDGPAASGKSSLSRELALQLKWQWLSTGVFYRGWAWAVLKEKQEFSQDNLVKMIKTLKWQVLLDKNQTCFIYKDQDVTKHIYNNAVDECASRLASLPLIRQALLPFQRACYEESPQGLVAEGRDCGTVVFPLAVLKVYLEARDNVRALRRAKQRGSFSVDEVMGLQKKRDHQDTHRVLSPLRAPEGAFIVDTSPLPLQDMVEKVHKRYKELLKGS